MANQVVKFGDRFYLKHESSKKYLGNTSAARYNWPQLSDTEHIELKLDGGKGEVTSSSYIKIKTTEQAVFNNDTLGAFADSHNCYYWKDEYDNGKQGWRITKVSGDAGAIFYGDRVHITNISYHNQRLALDTENQGYITTVENAGDSWILEPAAVKSVAQPTPDQEPISVPSVAQATPAQVTNQYQVQIQRGGSWQEDGMWAIGRYDSNKTGVINSIYLKSNDGGQTLNGNLYDNVPDELSVSVSPCQATRSNDNYYTVVESAAPSSREFTWVLGSRTDKHVIAINVESKDGGQTLNGTITYQGEEPIGFKGVRVENSAATSVAAAVKPVVQPSNSKSLSVFNWSVASGDPTKSGIILWTRVNPEAYDGTTPLKYQVARDQDFQSIVLEDQVNASEFGVERDYTVHIDLDGKLEANTSYFYRFIYKDVSSPIGRCKTLPAADAELSKLRLAVLTCNDYSSGYFNAFYELAKEDVDFVIHVGDFVYEYPQYPPGYGGKPIRTDLQLQEGQGQYEAKGISGGQRATTLANFRHIYRTYRKDPALQAAMEKHTWIIILDDHEIADNAYWDYEHGTLGAHPSHAIYEHYSYYGPGDKDFNKNDYYEGYEGDRAKISPEELKKKQQECRQEMRRLSEEAIQTWKEYVPARVTQAMPYEVEVNGKKEKHWRYKLYRNFRFGKLVDFYLTDSRSFRDKPEQEKNAAILETATGLKAEHPEMSTAERIALARKINNAGQTPPDWKWSMLGPEQKQWLINGITSSNASWRVWGNQTFLATSYIWEHKASVYDDWHGFKAERYEILQTIKEEETAKRRKDTESRFVVFTGDMHTSLIAYLKTDFEKDVKNQMNWNYSKLVGVEFMTPPLTSPGVSEQISSSRFASAASAIDVIGVGVIKAASPHIKHFDSGINGYAIAEFTPDELKWSVYQVNKIAYEKLDDENGSNVRNVSTNRVQKQLVHSATYQPNGIQLG